MTLFQANEFIFKLKSLLVNFSLKKYNAGNRLKNVFNAP